MTHDQHERIDGLLPWFVNGTLDDEERAEVRHHIGNCVACRGQLRELEDLGTVVREAPTPPLDVSPVAVERRAAAITEPSAARRLVGAPPRPRRLRWAVVSQAAVLALLATLLVLRHADERPERAEAPRFRTLASEPAVGADGSPRVRVLFAESITEQHLRQLLHEVDGRIVDGPSAAGLYTVELGSSSDGSPTLDERLRILQADGGVRFVDTETPLP